MVVRKKHQLDPLSFFLTFISSFPANVRSHVELSPIIEQFRIKGWMEFRFFEGQQKQEVGSTLAHVINPYLL